MTTIQPTPISADGYSSFNAALFDFIAPLEGDIPFVYSDGNHIPTLGIGYALLVGTPGAHNWTIRAGYAADLASAGIVLSQTQLTDLNAKLTQAMNALNGVSGATDPFYPADMKINPLGWTIDKTQSKNLFDNVVPTYEQRVKDWLGNDSLYTSYLGSTEMLALVSMAFNGVIGKRVKHGRTSFESKHLRACFLAGDRAEVWYQIRYCENGGHTDLAYRRYAEAAMFGLYPTDASGNIVMNSNVAKSTYQMFTLHRDKMLKYDSTSAHQDALITAWNMLLTFPTANPEDLKTTLATAANQIMSDLGNDADPDVRQAYIGQGRHGLHHPRHAQKPAGG